MDGGDGPSPSGSPRGSPYPDNNNYDNNDNDGDAHASGSGSGSAPRASYFGYGDDDEHPDVDVLDSSRFAGGGGGHNGDGDDGDDDGSGGYNDAGGADGAEILPDDMPGLDDANAHYDVLPPWASAENQALNKRIKEKEKGIQSAQEILQSNVDRVAVMGDHLKNVRQEHTHTQGLLDAKAKEITSEQHLNKLSQRNFGRLNLDISRAKKDTAAAQDEMNRLQNAVFAANERLEKFKLEMNWNHDELMQWSLAAKQKEDDHEAVAKYHKQDNTKLLHLGQQVEKQARVAHDAHARLQREVTETRTVQMELDALAEAFRRQHKQRQDLIRQWNEAMKAMHTRDDEILQKGEEIALIKVHVRQMEATVAEAEQVLAQETAQHKYLNNQLEFHERTAAQKRDALTGMRKEVEGLQDMVATQRGENEKAEGELNAATFLNTNLKDLQNEKSRKLEEYTQLVQATKEQLATGFSDTKDLAERARQIDELQRQHQQRLAGLNRALHGAKEQMFTQSHSLFELRKAEAALIAEISGAQGASRNLQSRVRELDQRSLRQQEMLYTIEFQVQQLERKVSHVSGKRSVEETVILNQKIAELQVELDRANAENNMLGGQVRALQEELRVARKDFDKTCADRQAAVERLNVAQLEVGTEDREYKKAVALKESLAVKHDEMALEAKKLGELLDVKKTKVGELEERKLQLELSMKEREKEVSLHKDVQRAEIKACEEARHTVMMDLRERQIKLDRIRAKYETINGKLSGLSTGADGEERTQAYYIIQAAQEREELQREGDELNGAIRRAEKEILMLAKTLKSLNVRNQNFREALHKADPESAEAQLKAQLEQKQRHVMEALHKKKQALRSVTMDFDERRRLLAELMQDIATVGREVQAQDKDLQQLRKQLSEQEQQLVRSTRLSQQKHAEYRKATSLGKSETSPEELFVSLQEQKRKNTLVVDLIRVFAEEHPQMKAVIADTMEEVGADALFNGNGVGGGNGNGGASSLPPVGRPGSTSSRGGLGLGGADFPPMQMNSGRGSSRGGAGTGLGGAGAGAGGVGGSPKAAVPRKDAFIEFPPIK